MFNESRKRQLPSPDTALPGRDKPLDVENRHYVTERPIMPPFPAGVEQLVLGMGCFWGAEQLFWQLEGVYTTAVGYAGGYTPNPTYEEVCSGQTGHTEVVLVVYDPAVIGTDALLGHFWEAHDPTQGMRQGNDIGTQYRSAIYCTNQAQLSAAKRSKDHYEQMLEEAGYLSITTEIALDVPFFYAETYHQQYLAKNPGGYCGLAGTGIAYAG